jgi:hypothetical protein
MLNKVHKKVLKNSPVSFCSVTGGYVFDARNFINSINTSLFSVQEGLRHREIGVKGGGGSYATSFLANPYSASWCHILHTQAESAITILPHHPLMLR